MISTQTIFVSRDDEQRFLEAVNVWNALPDGAVLVVGDKVDCYEGVLGFPVTCFPEDLFYLGGIFESLEGGAK